MSKDYATTGAVKFGRVKDVIPQEDGTTIIETNGYFEGSLNSVRREIQEDIMTKKSMLLADFIRCLDVINEDKTTEMTVEIKVRKDKIHIVKTWVIMKETNLGPSR